MRSTTPARDQSGRASSGPTSTASASGSAGQGSPAKVWSVQSAWPVELPNGKVPLAVWSYSEADNVLVASTAQFNSSNTYAWDISTMPATATSVGSYKSLDRAEQDGDLKLEAGSTANALQVENTATHKLVVQFSGPTGTQLNDFCILQGATGSAFTVVGADSNGNVYLWKIAN